MMSWAEFGAAPPDRAATGEAALIDAGQALYERARAARLAGRPVPLEALDDLVQALETWDAIHGGLIHPGAFWPDLEHDGQPYDTGLRRAAGDVLDAIAQVLRAAPALAGDGT